MPVTKRSFKCFAFNGIDTAIVRRAFLGDRQDAAAGESDRGAYQLVSHPSDAATHTAWALTSAQASSVSFCTFAITLGGMMSGQNFPAESFIDHFADAFSDVGKGFILIVPMGTGDGFAIGRQHLELGKGNIFPMDRTQDDRDHTRLVGLVSFHGTLHLDPGAIGGG